MKIITVKLTTFQKEKLKRAIEKNQNVSLKVVLSPTGDKIFVNDRQYNKIMKGKPVIITFNKVHYCEMKQNGGSMLSSLIGPLTKVASKVAPVLTKSVLPGIMTGVSSGLSEIGLKSLFGSGQAFHESKVGDLVVGLTVIENEIRQLSKCDEDMFDKMMMMRGNGQQSGGFLGTVLATIGIPLILKALTGSGLHNRPYDVKSYITHPNKIPIQKQNVINKPEGTSINEWELYNPLPFNVDHEIIEGNGIIKIKDQNEETGYYSVKTAPSKISPY